MKMIQTEVIKIIEIITQNIAYSKIRLQQSSRDDSSNCKNSCFLLCFRLKY